MTNLFKIITCFTLILGLKCTDESRKNEVFCQIDVEKNISKMETPVFSDYIDSVAYIPLTNCPFLIGRINNLEFHNDLILLADLDNCVLFDDEGKFVTKIGNKGHGPGEYTSVGSIVIGNDDCIYIGSNKSILVFDLHGKFIRQFEPEINRVGSVVRSWAIYNDSLFIGQKPNESGREKYDAVIFNRQGETLFAFRNNVELNKKDGLVISDERHANIYQFNGAVYYKELLNDTLFRVKNSNQFEPIYFFRLGEFSFPKQQLELGLNHFANTIQNYIFIDNIYESFSYLFLDCNFGNNSPAKREKPVNMNGHISKYYTYNVLGIYSKKNNELVFSKPENVDNHYMNKGLYNDFDGGLKFHPSARVDDSTFAMWIDAFVIKVHVASEAFKTSTPKYPEKKRELEQLANSLSDNDNPVLMLVKLKE